MKKSIVLLTVLMCQSLTSNSQNNKQQTTIENHLKTFPNSEIAIGIIDEQRELKLGYRIVDGNLTAVDNATALFEIGSITKVFVAALLAREISESTMSLKDPVRKHIDFKIKNDTFNGKTIQLRHLATHTSGLKKNPLVSYKRYIKYLSGFELDYLPGENWEYNNMTVALMGEILALKNNKTWEVLLNQNLLLPLEMSNTYASVQKAPEDNRVQCTKKNGKVNDCYFHKMGTFQWPSGGIISTLDDMMKWLNANLHKNKDKEELEFIHIAHNPLEKAISIPWFEIYNAKQGIVWWHFKTDSGNSIICHGGNMPAQTSFMAFDKAMSRPKISQLCVNLF